MRKFDWINRLGSGYFGEVWLARDLTLDVERAVKVIPGDKLPDHSNFFKEAQVLKSVEHANIVRVEEAGPLANGGIYVAMEYLKKGSLDDEARGNFVPLSRAKRVMIDVLRGLHHVHELGIIHRDIKPGNILVGPSREAKLSDFGLAIDIGVDASQSSLLGQAYLYHLAPEILLGGGYGVETDIYACGVTLYRLVNGDSYLPTSPRRDIIRLISEGKYPDTKKYREFVPRSLRQIINRALQFEPNDRFQSAKDMRRALERVQIKMNWTEKRLRGKTEWHGTWGGVSYEVVRGKETRTQDTYFLDVSKAAVGKPLRRIRSLCPSNLDRKTVNKVCRRVLQSVVSGKQIRQIDIS